MTIKSDRWIRQMSTTPTHRLTKDGQTIKYLSPPYTEWESGMIRLWEQKHEHGMMVTERGEYVVKELSDAERANFQPMIEPFVAEQVRYQGVDQTSLEKGDHYLVDTLEERDLGDFVIGDVVCVKETMTRYVKMSEMGGDGWKPLLDADGNPDTGASRVISYGNSSYGYDARCAEEFKIFTNINNAVVDPKNFSDECLVDHKGPYCIIPPNSFALARTVEYFRIPEDTLVVCLGKSTYARCGIIVNVTPLEPGWEGHVTLEFSNTTNLPAKIYANEGVCQFLFLQSDERCDVSYKDRNGKYMGQRGVTNPRM